MPKPNQVGTARCAVPARVQRAEPRPPPSKTVIQQPIITPAPATGQLIIRNGSAAGRPGQIVTAANRWRENYNPLRRLTMARAVDLLELGQRGDYAYLQWAYHFCERRNPTLAGLVSRCEAPLMSFDWSIKKTTMLPAAGLRRGRQMDRDEWAGQLKAANRAAKIAPVAADALSPGRFKAMAERQKRTLETAYNAIDNLRKAIMHLHKADFRGYAHLQKHRNGDGRVYHLECLDQWCVCRDGLNGNWFWNPDGRSTSAPLQFLGLDYCIGGPRLPLPDFIIREVARPIDEFGIINTVRRGLCEKDWDAFIEIYGLPGGIVIMPPGIPVGEEREYEESARRVAEGASGALPNGSDYKPNIQPRSQDPFTPRLEKLDADMVLAGTGGKLTMLTEHNPGQARGNSRVHDETFGQIANGRALDIAELFQIHFDAEVLNREHPGEPHLVYFYFGGEETIDVDGLCNNVNTLSQAGKTVNTEWLGEKTGYEFEEDADV